MRKNTLLATAASLFITIGAFSLTSFDRLQPGALASQDSPAEFEQATKEQPPSDGPDSIDKRPVKLTPHNIVLSKTKKFDLYLPEDFEITIAARGLKRVRFLARSPDNRIFVTDMFNRTDNSRGAVYILDDFDAKSGKFARVTAYLTGLRNPNSIAFHTDARGSHWFYLALTDRLLRYKYTAGELVPSSSPEVLATFPDYGLSYKYGGWHLTRTIALGNGKLYISVGSSCNSCEETEAVRASVLEMDLDGKNQRAFVTGLRNAVGLKWVKGQLYATNMGADHLGDFKPDDAMFVVQNGMNYGWPYCYEYKNQIYADNKFSESRKKIDCKVVPTAYIAFGAHSSPLGFDYFDSSNTATTLKNYFLVALHGSSKRPLKRGYSVMRVKKGAPVQDFIRGFLQNGIIYGRPADVMSFGKNAFLVTDDYSGVIYYVYQKEKP